MSRKHVALVIVLVLAPLTGGVTATLGASADDAARTQASPTDLAVQDQGVNNTTISFENQTTDGTVVTVSQVTLAEGGFVTIHDQTLLNGSVLGSVLGTSSYLEPGTYENVTVELDDPLTESQSLLALAYQDTNDNQTFDFITSQGQDDDPYSVDNQVVADSAFVTVEGAPQTTTETTTTETTTTETTTTETTTTETTTTETTTTETTVVGTTTETTTTETTAVGTPTETTTTAGEGIDEQLYTYEFDFRVDQFSMVVGEGEVERNVTIEDRVVRDETVLVDLTALLAGASVEESTGSLAAEGGEPSPDELQTVRIVAQNVTLDNASFLVVGPAGLQVEIEQNETSELGESVTTTTTTETTTTETTTTEAPFQTTTVVATTVGTTTATTTTATTTTETTTTETTTTTEAPSEVGSSLRVSAITAPGTVVLNDDPLVVTAKIRNPNDVVVSNRVDFRVGGTLVQTQAVKLDPGETLQLQFTVNKQGLDVVPGESFIGVLTRDYGKNVNITVAEPDATTVEA